MNYRMVQVNFQLDSFNFYPICTTWFDKLWALLCSYLKAYILEATRTWYIQHEFSDCNLKFFQNFENLRIIKNFEFWAQVPSYHFFALFIKMITWSFSDYL